MTGAAALLLYLYAFSLAYQGLDAGVGALILYGVNGRVKVSQRAAQNVAILGLA